MTVQLAAVPCFASVTPENVILFSNGKTVEVELKSYKQWNYTRHTVTDKCFVQIWQNSADLGEACRAVFHILQNVPECRNPWTVWECSIRSQVKSRATRLRNLGVNLNSLIDPSVVNAKKKKEEQKEKNLNDLRELASSLS
jgi:hypothetical protein